MRGVTEHLKADGLFKDGCLSVQLADDEKELKASCKGYEQGFSGRYHDDLTGQTIKDEMVTRARIIKLDLCNKKGVCCAFVARSL